MPRLVEDAGEPLSAGWLARFVKATGMECDVLSLGDREVEWELRADAVQVAHAPADRTGATLRYRVGLLYTELPSGGARWWWKCPACEGRVDALYLPTERDRLACRKCCGLVYASQYPGRKPRRRKLGPVVVIEWERQQWTSATGWVVLSRKRVRR